MEYQEYHFVSNETILNISPAVAYEDEDLCKYFFPLNKWHLLIN